MKNRLLFLMAMFMAQALHAQNDNLVSYLHHLVDSLDKSEVNSNFLWDKGTNGFAEPAIYDGALRDSVYLQPSAFGFLYVQASCIFVRAG